MCVIKSRKGRARLIIRFVSAHVPCADPRMEDWATSELALLGVDDASVYAQAFVSLLVGSPHDDAAYAQESLAEAVGYADRRALSRAFKRWTGLTPAAYRRRERG